MTCDRCHQEARASTGSYFNTDQICLKCAEVERQHPAFEEARRIENEAVRAGNYNFGGVGLPESLRTR